MLTKGNTSKTKNSGESSGVVEGYTMEHCTVPLGLNYGSKFATGLELYASLCITYASRL